MERKSGINNSQVLKTRSWIFEALIHLMDEKAFEKIKVSDISKKAGIARQTFYRNYRDKYDVIGQFLNDTFNMKFLTTEQSDIKNNVILTFHYKYLVKHHKNLKKILTTMNIDAVFAQKLKEWRIKIIECYKERLSPKEYQIWRYKVYYQISGCFQILNDWFINDRPIPVKDIMLILNSFAISNKVR
ncbi:MAG: TetR/AcrR family transcriptional regulator, partial [Syntrophomonadaceae bacterium]|nr:TetR/AcrR family transcriptional regulator [Syntrophomonadaceae bacterium]